MMAHIVDGLVWVPIGLAFGMSEVPGLEEPGIVAAALAALGLIYYQFSLPAHTGQMIGKRAIKVRIVDVADGSKPGSGRAVGMRGFVNGLITAVPWPGARYAIANLLFIFHADRRCIHDHLARTIVVSEA